MILVGIRNVRKYYIRSYKLTLEADMKQAKVLTEKELKKVVDYINGMDRHAIRNKTMLLLTHYCGFMVNGQDIIERYLTSNFEYKFKLKSLE